MKQNQLPLTRLESLDHILSWMENYFAKFFGEEEGLVLVQSISLADALYMWNAINISE